MMGIPRPRLNSPFWQNVIIGILVGLTAGLYVALNLLGAGGGRPNAATTVQGQAHHRSIFIKSIASQLTDVQIVNATLCAVWFFSASFGGSVLNKIGPAITACLGVLGYILYVGSLWYFDQTGKEGFPIFAGVAIGISAGLIFVCMGYIAMSYSEERERGKFVVVSINLQAVGSVVGGIIPLIINRNSSVAAGVPAPVYIVFMILMGIGACMAFLLLPPSKVRRDDGTPIAVIKSRGFLEELKANLEIFKDPILMMMVPAFLPAECFLVYAGSVNAFHNSLRARSLLSFMAVVLQIPAGFGLQMILDNEKWKRKTRAFIGLAVVGVPLIGAWIWEIVRVRNYDRSAPPTTPLDWNDPNFAAIFILFMLTWVSSSLWQYIILYFLGTLTNHPRKSANYAGVFRGFLGAGEAICFGLDSIAVQYVKEAGVIFAFYTTGVLIFVYLAAFHIKETKYFTEDEVVVPKHLQEEHDGEITHGEELKGSDQTSVAEQQKVAADEKGLAPAM